MLSTSSAPAISAKAAAQDVEATTFFGAAHTEAIRARAEIRVIEIFFILKSFL